MPSTGFYLFLRSRSGWRRLFLQKRVNALNGLLLISSPKDTSISHIKKLCQCPQRASTYFFCVNFGDEYMEICVNALNGLLLISSKQTKAKASKTVDVSMPSTGFYLFLPSRTENQKHAGLESVNALNGLLLISSTLLKGQAYIDKCVSMPSTGFYLFLLKSEK